MSTRRGVSCHLAQHALWSFFCQGSWETVDCDNVLLTDTVLSLVKTVLKPNVEENSGAASDNATNHTGVLAGDNITSSVESSTVNNSADSCELAAG